MTTPSRSLPFPGRYSSLPGKYSILLSFVLLFTSYFASAQPCATPPAVTIGTQSASSVCGGQPFSLVLTSAANGTAPFDLTITFPDGTPNTFTGVNVGDVITTFAPPTENIWPDPLVPLPPSHIDAPVTLGVKFQSSVRGFVKGVRFFSADNVSVTPGDYTGQLWNESGTLLASGTFTNLTTDSWQELIFDQPVLIDAATTYIASYHTKFDTYVISENELTTAVTNGSLTALDDATAGGNGVYAYGSTANFPVYTFNASNYWVDVIFSPEEFTFNLTDITDDEDCNNTGALQTLVVTSVDCSTLPLTMAVQPSITLTAIGQQFSVTVASDFAGVPPGPDIDDIEVHLQFDDTKLQVVSITEEPVALAFTDKPIPAAATGNQVNYHATTTVPVPADDFSILTITFEVIGGAGTTTPLTLRRDPPTDETRIAGGGASILASVSNATVTINADDCVVPTVTLSAPAGALTCNGQSFDLVLAASPAPVGVEPFDLTISGPGGTFTYNDVPIGGTITNFVPTVENIWPASYPLPIPPTETDLSVTLGVKFRSSVSGFVKGIRFFSPDDVSTGDFTGQLWSESGDLLASGTFSAVTASAWQELTFATPILIDANTIYVASYHTTSINYVQTQNGLVNDVSNGSLTAPGSASVGGNGVYTYGGTPTFPTESVDGHYWVDVMFAPNVYSFNLIGITDANGCANVGASLQALSVTSVDCNVLPVTLLNFSATPKDKAIALAWSTASESNNKGFNIERSQTGSSWTTIGFVAGAGNSSNTNSYAYLDGGLTAGRYFYRLKQIDLDGKFEYSSVVSAVIGGSNGFVLEQNFPNPFKNGTVIRFTLPSKAKVNLSVFDINGRLVKVVMNESRDAGTHAVNVNSGSLVAGLYYYKLQAGEHSAVKKMTIQ